MAEQTQDTHRHLGVSRGATRLDEYESSDAYADQDDERVIKVLQFPYHVRVPSPMVPGEEVIQERVAYRGDTVYTDELGLLAQEKGERLGAFFTTDELERMREGKSVLGPPIAELGQAPEDQPEFAELGEHEMVEYLEANKPNVPDTVALVGTDAGAARRLLAAENTVTGNDPRAGVEQGLTRIIQENS